ESSQPLSGPPRSEGERKNFYHGAGSGVPAPQSSREARGGSRDFYRGDGNAAHHHRPYGAEERGEELRKLGVERVPEPIRDRSHILDTDRAHSLIDLPSKGRDGRTLNEKIITRTEYNGALVRSHMASIETSARMTAIVQLNVTENQPNHYYWHHD